MTTELTVYIVDDDPAVLDSLSEMVKCMGMKPVCYSNADGFLGEFDPSRPGCLVLDLRLPGMNGTELQEQLAARRDSLPVIMITGHGDVASGVRAMKLGVVDYLEKPYAPQQLRQSILEALDLDVRRRRAQARRADIEQRLARLTPEERAVANLITMGHTNREISLELDISIRTVQLRRTSIMRKLKLTSRAELVRLVRSSEALERVISNSHYLI